MFLKSDGNPKHFSFFVLDFNVSNSNFLHPQPAIKFSRICHPLHPPTPFIPTPSFIRFWRIFYLLPPPLLLFIPTPLPLGTQEWVFWIFHSLSMLHKNIHNIITNKKYIYLIFYNIYPLGHEIIISVKNHVIPFLNNISLSKDFWLFSDGLYNAIKIASMFFLRCFCEEAGHKTFHLYTCLMLLLVCSAGSDLWSGLLCSYQRVTLFCAVSSM